jgi:hypothetical protein
MTRKTKMVEKSAASWDMVLCSAVEFKALTDGCEEFYLLGYNAVKKSEAILVTGRGGLQGCDMIKIPHCLDNGLTDGSNVVSPTHRPHSTPQKHFSASGTHFC